MRHAHQRAWHGPEIPAPLRGNRRGRHHGAGRPAASREPAGPVPPDPRARARARRAVVRSHRAAHRPRHRRGGDTREESPPARRGRVAARRPLAVSDLRHETLLMLAPGFGSRRLFEEACHEARVEPRSLVESRSPRSLIALAAGGHGIAIVPSVVTLSGAAIAVAGLVRNGRPLGTWTYAVWDTRRHLPLYAASFLKTLVECTRHSYPGHRLGLTREVRRPPEMRTAPGGSRA